MWRGPLAQQVDGYLELNTSPAEKGLGEEGMRTISVCSNIFYFVGPRVSVHFVECAPETMDEVCLPCTLCNNAYFFH